MSENTVENYLEDVPAEVSGRDFPGPGEDFAERTAAHIQHQPVQSETAGYLAPGGRIRPSIRDRIRAARPYVSENVDMPEWDATVEVRSLSLGQRQAMFVDLSDPDTGELDKALLEAGYIRAACYDAETGERIFADDDLEFIQNLPAGVADKVGSVAMKLSGNADKKVEETQEAEAKK